MSKVIDVCNYLLSKYPIDLASSFDFGKVGLQFGNKSKHVSKVLITLDATTEVLKEAISLNVDMIITHHPFLFSPILNLDYQSPLGEKMILVLQNELNIFSMHTNYDVAKGGMNEILANMLGLKDVYSVPEIPTAESYMRIGLLDNTTLKDLALKVKTTFNEQNIRVVGTLDKKIKKVAVLGGSGGNYAIAAKKLGCDCIITGEVKHNNAIDAIDYNIGVIEVSHSIEAYFKQFLKADLEEEFKDIEFIISCKDVNPFKVI